MTQSLEIKHIIIVLQPFNIASLLMMLLLPNVAAASQEEHLQVTKDK